MADELNISYYHPGPEADRKREAAWALNSPVLLPSRPCPVCGQLLLVTAPEYEVRERERDLGPDKARELAERQIEEELQEVLATGGRLVGCPGPQKPAG